MRRHTALVVAALPARANTPGPRHRLEPGDPLGRGHEPGRLGQRERPAGIAATGRLQIAAIGTPEAHPGTNQRTQAIENVVQPSYRRRSIMQMEFPCSLN